MDKIDANTRNWIIGGAVAIIVVVLGWWLFTSPKKVSETVPADSTMQTSSETSTASTGDSTTVTSAEGEALSVADQPAGDSVRVTAVSVGRTSWVSIRDTKSILGAARVEPGMYDVVSVPLMRNTTAGSSYQVQLFVDDGDQIFDWRLDALVSGVGGEFSALSGD